MKRQRLSPEHAPERYGRPRPRRPYRVHRRDFLRGAGGALVGLPMLSSLMPRGARGQETSPKRFVVVSINNGTIPEAWFPLAGANPSSFTLGTIHQPLVPWQDQLILFEGINMPSVAGGPGEPHQSGMGGVLTGWPLLEPSAETGSFIGGDGSLAGWGSSISVDQRIAQEIGATTPLASLHLGVRASTAEVRSRISYLGPAMPLPPINDPTVTFMTLFSDYMTEDGALARLHAQRRSVLDAVRQQFELITPKLSGSDRVKLEAHQELVRDIELRLEANSSSDMVCQPPTAPPSLDVDSEVTMPQISELQIDMMAAAFACDLTRVATLQYSNAQNHIRMPWVDTSPEDPLNFEPSMGDGHSLSHAGPSATASHNEIVQRQVWYASQIARLCEKLAAIPEGGGSVLDNTAILWVNELSVGNTHSHTNMPFLLVGSAGGALETGRYLQYPDSASHNELLLSLVQAYGGSDMTFGDPAFCPGPLPDLL